MSMTLHAPVHPAGTRIVVRRGRFPIDATMVGRAGTVVEVSDYRPDRYGVVLDGENEVRDFDGSELERAPA